MQDDPVLGLLSGMEDLDGDNEDSALIVGPKFTVRLPQPIYIDAATLEHRSFPPTSFQDGLSGGESAPRWVRLVGFPPCSGSYEEEDDKEGGICRSFGFDISHPIDLGSIGYQRITAAKQEIPPDEGEVSSDRFRRRSLQTFDIQRGTLLPLHDDSSESTDDNAYEEHDAIFDPVEMNF